MIEYLAPFAFPLFLFLIGAYLVFRGASRPETKSLAGVVRCPRPLRSPLGGKRAAYFRLVVEAYVGGHEEWKELCRFESTSGFTLSGKPVDLEFSDIRITKTAVSEGYVRRKKGALEEFGENIYRWARPMAGWRGRPYLKNPLSLTTQGEVRYLDDSLVKLLVAIKPINAALAKNIRKPLRITESVIEDGARIAAVSASDDLKGTIEHPILITDAPLDDAIYTVGEKARTSLLLGAGLVLFSLAISFLLLLSL